jgi:hypothetical protein
MMTTRMKLVVAVLVWITLWPLAQIALVAAYDVDAWKLGGWGMYATPSFSSPVVRVSAARSGDEQATRIHSLPRSARRELERFVRWRGVFATLYEPRALATILLETMPAHDRLELVVAEERFRRDRAIVEQAETVYRYSRRSPSGVTR